MPQGLAHPNIVSLSNIFEVDNNTFATVLELCEGGDLDTHLREHGVRQADRETNALQLCSALSLSQLALGAGGTMSEQCCGLLWHNIYARTPILHAPLTMCLC